MPEMRIPVPLFRTIIFAADFSDRSRKAFDVACLMAREEATRLIVLHVVEPLPVNETMVGVGEMGVPLFVPEKRPIDSDALMKTLRETYTPGQAIAVEYRITEGDAAAEVLRLAEETKCDLIAMGTHGRTGLERLVVGSVAETVMRKAHCPVLTVRSPSSAHSPAADLNPPAAVIA